MPTLEERYNRAKQDYHKTGEQLKRSKGTTRPAKQKRYDAAKQKYRSLGARLRLSKKK